MQAADIMTLGVVTATPEMGVRDAAALMLGMNVSALPVLDHQDRLVGIISEGDLVRRTEMEAADRDSWWLSLFTSTQARQERFLRSHGQRVGDVMTRDLVFAAPDTPVAEIATILEKHRIKRVPVVEGGRVLGIVSRANLLHALANARIPASAGTSDDRALRWAVLKTFNREAGLGGSVVNVTVSDGSVGLWGTVRTDTEEQALVIAARSVPGVLSVESNLGRVQEWAYG